MGAEFWPSAIRRNALPELGMTMSVSSPSDSSLVVLSRTECATATVVRGIVARDWSGGLLLLLSTA